MIVIEILGVASPLLPDISERLKSERLWIKSHKDTPCGRGNTVLTPNVEEALKFESNADALMFWRQESRSVPLRDDGRPNRPMTMFTVEIGHPV